MFSHEWTKNMRRTKWGLNCLKVCGFCKDYEKCNYITGICENGCREGVSGELCNGKKKIALKFQIALYRNKILCFGTFKIPCQY